MCLSTLQRLVLGILALVLLFFSTVQAQTPRLSLLFLGDNAGHRPSERFRELAPVLKKRGIDLTYTDKLTDLTTETLGKYDGLVIYANHTKITPEQEKVLVGYVEGGKALIALHSASFCFLNSPAYIEMVGAQFRSHDAGIFRTTVVAPDHPLMKGYRGFESWDETYLHHKHNPKNRTVLEERVEGKLREPWTWVRTQGKGRVFYTAWGHDARTWTNPGFANLVERGIRWATGGDPGIVPPLSDGIPTMTPIAKDAPKFEYIPAKLPFYPAGTRWGTTADPLTTMQKPLDPAGSIKHTSVPEGFELQLFADEKLLGGKPICIAWDERGRLWAAITRDYPNEMQPKGKGRDRIVIAEDTNGDGVGDKVTTFADKLSIPTSLAFARGGIVVVQAPETLFLKDTNGDDVADERTVLFSGWHTNDTHAGPSNLRYGLDNWLHGMVGYAGFDGTVGKEKHSFRTGFFRVRPDGSALEFLRNTNNNSWGVGFSEEGFHFGSTANGNPSVYLPIPNRYYENVRGWSSTVLGGIAGPAKITPITDKVRQVDHHGGFTAAAGHALYTARSYPAEYWNRTAFVTEPTGHLISTFVITPRGADFTSRNPWNLLASQDEWCAPIMAEVGPDGSVWILDWYNIIVQHNPTPAGFKTGKGNAYETDLRDTKYGRVYRLVYKAAKPSKKPDLSTVAGQLAALGHDNMLWRLHAQRLLVERGKTDVVPDLLKRLEDKSTDAIGLNVGAIHALWTLHGLKAIDERMLIALKHPSAGVRRNAALVGANTLALLPLLKDDDAQVKLAALLALAEKPANDEAGRALAALTPPLDDRWLMDAYIAACAAHATAYLEAAPNAPTRVAGIVAEHWARGEGADAERFFAAVAKQKAPDAALAGLVRGWKTGRKVKLSDPTQEAFLKLMSTAGSSGKASLLRILPSLGVTSEKLREYVGSITRELLASLENANQTDTVRVTAAQRILETLPDDEAMAKRILERIDARSSPELASGLIDALTLSRAPATPELLLEKLPSWTPATKTAALRALLGQPKWALALLESADKGTVRLSELSLDQKQALAAHPDSAVRARAKKVLAKGGDLPNADRQKVIDGLLPLLKQKGDIDKGKVVFKNQCAKCHKHGGEGTDIGPDLTGMASHPKLELLIHIMDPSRSVEGNFRVWNIVTNTGRSYTGMLASETKTTVEIIDAEAKRSIVRRDRIERLEASNKSLMPEGFEKQIKDNELVDLLEFLTSRGKYLPLPLDRVATIVSTRGMFFDPKSTIERLVFADWKPKMVGEVPFYLVDPQGDTKRNVVLLHGPNGTIAPTMPKAVKLPCNAPAKAIHILGGIAGWGSPFGRKGSTSMIVRLHYEDGKTEDHTLLNGEHIADYIRREDVPGSKYAFNVQGKQVRYLSVTPKRDAVIKDIEFVKGSDQTAPIVVAVTVEGR
jgi:putative membrane-bound dehydrogenase-like protein